MLSNKKREWGYGRVFLIAVAVSACFFLPAIIWDRGYFIFLGDFNSQQIPFYQVAHRAIRAGNIGWNWYTDLGANFIGSYSFYLLGSPFFWLTIPFPTKVLPYLMGPLLILKFGCTAVTSFAWIKRHVNNKDFALLGALLYAFSGFSIYNIFFNHFHEAMVFFPLLMIGIDELMDHGTRGAFALAVFINAVVSYFFFVGEVVFTVVYFFVRVFTKGYAFTWKRFAQVAIEAVLGFLMSQCLFLPSLLVMLSNYRVANYPDGIDVWVYANNQRLYVILMSFLFPNELPSKQVLFPDANVRWTSLSAYLPLFSMAGVHAYMKSHKKNWLTVLIIVLFVMALVPGLNSLFVAFNKAFYARWFYMFVLMLSLATVRVLDEGNEKELERSTFKVLVLTTVIILILALTPDKLKDGTWRIGLFASDAPWQFGVIALVAVLSPGILLLLLGKLKSDPKLFAKRVVLTVCIISIIYGNFYIVWGKTRSYDTHDYFIPDVLEGSLSLDEETFYRIDADDSVINIGMFWNVPDIRAFHSLVPAGVFGFYDFLGEKRGVKSVPSYDQYAIRSLLSVKYFVDSKKEGDEFLVSDTQDGTVEYSTQMPGYSNIGEQNHYDIYRNLNFIPMGFTYDTYCTQSEAETVPENHRGVLMLQNLIVSDDQADTVSGVLRHDADVQIHDFSEAAYVEACAERQLHCASTFDVDTKGFSASIYSETENILFFSVPYEEGWSATVNGEEAEIIQANVGFMAVRIPQGSSNVRFTYETPGRKTGLMISIASGLILIGYVVIAKKMDRKKASF